MADTKPAGVTILRDALVKGTAEEAEDGNDTTKAEGDDKTKDTEVAEGAFTEEEQEAIEQGWDPEYDGPDKRTAREFLDRGQFIKRISDQTKQIRALNKQVKFLLERDQVSRKEAVETALKQYKEAKKVAVEDRDGATVVDLDEKIRLAQEQLGEIAEDALEAVEEDSGVEVPEEFRSWVDKNKWYENDAEMRAVGEAVGHRYLAANPDSKPLEVLRHVETRVREMFPKSKYFANSRKATPRVEGGGGTRRGTGTGSKHTVADLDSDERAIMKQMVARGRFKSEEAYVAQLEKTGYFKTRN